MNSRRTVTVAILQGAFGDDLGANLATIEGLVRDAAKAGAQVILPPELFQGTYFCREEHPRFFKGAFPAEEHPVVLAMQGLAKALRVVIPTSFFEAEGPHYYNSLAMIDADGSILGVYRKSHIPDGPGYEEKYYFRAGNTGFKVWETRYGCFGVGVCWDQWFPETARAMTLMGAEVLFYPTAIGSEPEEPEFDSKDPWQRVMIGHAVANVIPVVASNRVGNEDGQIFYGSSFIADYRGDKLVEASRSETGFWVAEFDLDAIKAERASMGFFRDRRPDLYGAITESK